MTRLCQPLLEEAEMTVETITEHGEPDAGRTDPALRTPAGPAQFDPGVARRSDIRL